MNDEPRKDLTNDPDHAIGTLTYEAIARRLAAKDGAFSILELEAGYALVDIAIEINTLHDADLDTTVGFHFVFKDRNMYIPIYIVTVNRAIHRLRLHSTMIDNENDELVHVHYDVVTKHSVTGTIGELMGLLGPASLPCPPEESTEAELAMIAKIKPERLTPTLSAGRAAMLRNWIQLILDPALDIRYYFDEDTIKTTTTDPLFVKILTVVGDDVKCYVLNRSGSNAVYTLTDILTNSKNSRANAVLQIKAAHTMTEELAELTEKDRNTVACYIRALEKVEEDKVGSPVMAKDPVTPLSDIKIRLLRNWIRLILNTTIEYSPDKETICIALTEEPLPIEILTIINGEMRCYALSRGPVKGLYKVMEVLTSRGSIQDQTILRARGAYTLGCELNRLLVPRRTDRDKVKRHIANQEMAIVDSPIMAKEMDACVRALSSVEELDGVGEATADVEAPNLSATSDSSSPVGAPNLFATSDSSSPVVEETLSKEELIQNWLNMVYSSIHFWFVSYNDILVFRLSNDEKWQGPTELLAFSDKETVSHYRLTIIINSTALATYQAIYHRTEIVAYNDEEVETYHVVLGKELPKFDSRTRNVVTQHLDREEPSEDARDIAAAQAALDEPGESIPWDNPYTKKEDTSSATLIQNWLAMVSYSVKFGFTNNNNTLFFRIDSEIEPICANILLAFADKETVVKYRLIKTTRFTSTVVNTVYERVETVADVADEREDLELYHAILDEELTKFSEVVRKRVASHLDKD